MKTFTACGKFCLLLLASTYISGCALILADDPAEAPDFNSVHIGADRAQIESILGGAVAENTDYQRRSNVSKCTYQVYIRDEKQPNAGFRKSISRAMLGFRKEVYVIQYDAAGRAIGIEHDSIDAVES